MFTTDGFTVQPIEFPGGNIGSLAVHGTVNDLSVSGADPLYLSLNLFLEEGLEVELLERVVAAWRPPRARPACRSSRATPRSCAAARPPGLYLATTGVGVRPAGLELGLGRDQRR